MAATWQHIITRPGRFAVVGRWSRTAYGPFGTVAEAESFLRTSLRATERQYEIVRAAS
jgi:hypothetical protein